jgi:hypothetical protein
MAQAVRRRPPIAEARVRSRVSPCGIYGGQSGCLLGQIFSEFFGLPCQYHSTASVHTHTHRLGDER